MLQAFVPTHSPLLVALSILVAVLASYTALDVVARLSETAGLRRRLWLCAGAGTLGGGIWAMHFIAMQAFRLPIAIAYDPLETVASLLVAIFETGLGLVLVCVPKPSGRRLLAAGAMVGLGIALMHYMGMSAMLMGACIVYEPGLFLLSVVLAIAAATAAFWLAANVRNLSHRWLAALAMGVAIAGMHYTGMAAANFLPTDEFALALPGIHPAYLALATATATLLILALAVVSVVVDRRLSEAEQREAAMLRRFRALIQNSSDIIVLFDRQGQVVYASPSAARVSGLSLEDIQARRFEKMMDPDEYAKMTDLLDTLEDRQGASVQGQVRLTHPQRGPICFEIIATNLHDDPVVGALVMNLRDVTEREAALAEAVAAREQAELASRSKSEFLASMSHELRTPLNAIIGFAELLEGEMLGPLGNERYREYAGDIRGSGQFLLNIINDILDVARIEHGQFELTEEPVEVEELLESCLRLVEARALRSSTSIRIAVDPGLPLLFADPRKLKQVVLNLVSNSVKFAAGGNVRLSARRAADAGLEIVVVDDGVGIAPEQLERVLQPFVQGDASLARRYEGIGLGLYIARRIVELHGGGLRLESEPGQGTTVTVALPAERCLDEPAPSLLLAGE